MIPITPEIIGPGMEEEYADALEQIGRLEEVLAPFPASNDTREGRLVYLVKWLRQEIEGQRLPIPLDRKHWGTLGHLVGEGSLDYLGADQPMAELWSILNGIGLLKERHYPVVVAMLDDFVEYLKPVMQLEPIENQSCGRLRANMRRIWRRRICRSPIAPRSSRPGLIEECRQIRDGIAAHAFRLPLDKSKYPGWHDALPMRNLKQLPDFLNRRRTLGSTLFSAWRPLPARKAPLVAPKPGLVWGGR